MTISKRILSAVCCIAICLSCMAALTACRTKDETIFSFKSGDKIIDVKAGTYLYFLVDSYYKFRNEVDKQIQSASQTTAADFDYEKQTVGDKDYVAWASNDVYELCAEYAYIEAEFDRLGLELTADQQSYADQQASTEWASYSYFYEQNGVSYTTFKNMVTNGYIKKSAVFDYYYGEATKEDKKKDANKGSLRPDAATIKKGLNDNYLIVDKIDVSLTKSDGSDVVSLSDTEKAAEKKKLQKYADRLNNGEIFATIYKEVNGQDIDSDSASGGNDKYATLYGSEDTAYYSTSEYYDELKKLSIGKATVVEFADKLMLAVKQDITKDSYYLDNLSDQVVSVLKYEEFENNCKKAAKEMEVVKNEGAISYYTPNKVKVETETQTVATTA